MIGLMEDRKEIIQKLRNRRLTYQAIGDMLGVSRQRIHQILTSYTSPSERTLGLKNNKYTVVKKGEIFTQIPGGWSPSGGYDSKGLGGIEGRNFLKELVRKRDNVPNKL